MIGYFAPPATAPHVDLGPIDDPWARQQFEKGLKAMVDYARTPKDPTTFDPRAPELQRYQEAMQDLTRVRPDYASELAMMSSQVAKMGARRLQRRARVSRSPALALGISPGYAIVPAPSPAFTMLDLVWAGVPYRIARRRVY